MATTRDYALTCSVCSGFLEELETIKKTDWLAATKTEMMMKAVEKQLIHEKKEHYKKHKTYAFTFTTNQNTKEEIQKEMCESAWRLLNQKTTPVVEGQVYLEYTEEGRPHLHGWYKTESGGRIFAKTFKRCWQFWGEKNRMTKFPGGYHEEMKTDRYLEYASSEGRLVVRKSKDNNAELCENYHIYNPT